METMVRHAGGTMRMLATAGLLVLLAACSRETEEVRLRTAIDAMQTAAVERRPADAMVWVADDFIGNGSLDRAALHNLLRAQTLRNASISATRGPLDITLQGERATVNFSVVLTGGAGGLLPERAQSYAIASGWRLEEGEWRMFLADWESQL